MSHANGDQPQIPHPLDLTDEDILRVMDAALFEEIDHHGPEAAAVHELRHDLEPLLSEVVMALHDTRALAGGQQWTIPTLMSCGFAAEIVVRVRRLGPDHDAERREPG